MGARIPSGTASSAFFLAFLTRVNPAPSASKTKEGSRFSSYSDTPVISRRFSLVRSGVSSTFFWPADEIHHLHLSTTAFLAISLRFLAAKFSARAFAPARFWRTGLCFPNLRFRRPQSGPSLQHCRSRSQASFGLWALSASCLPPAGPGCFARVKSSLTALFSR